MLLTNVMLYWVTGAIGSSFWPYYAACTRPWPITEQRRRRCRPRTLASARDRPPAARVGRGRVPTSQRWTTMPAGGHFAALEEPEALAADIRAFFRDFR